MGTKQPERPEDTTSTSTSTGTGASEDTGTDIDDAKKAGLRPTGSGGSAPPSENR
jgi:hypothetical protein